MTKTRTRRCVRKEEDDDDDGCISKEFDDEVAVVTNEIDLFPTRLWREKGFYCPYRRRRNELVSLS